MKGKSKSKKILETNKSKPSIENMYKKYKSQESYNDFKILTRNTQTKINLNKHNIVGISPKNNNLTNNSQNSNSNFNSSTKNSQKQTLKLKNFYETTNSSNSNFFKMISPINLKSNIFSSNNKNLKENTLKKFKFQNRILDKNASIKNSHRKKSINNSFEVDEINIENELNIKEESLYYKLNIKTDNSKCENDLVKNYNDDINENPNEIKNNNRILNRDKNSRKNSNCNLIINSDIDCFKNSNNFYTNSICEASESFIENGDRKLINLVPDTFVRQTDNKLLENRSSKKLIEITNNVDGKFTNLINNVSSTNLKKNY